MSHSDPSRSRVISVVIATIVVAVGYVLLAGDETGQLAAGGVVMLGAAALGVLQGYRRRSTRSRVGALALLAGGSYGVALATAGQDPFTDNVVLGLVVVGLVVGLFDSPGGTRGDEASDGQRSDGATGEHGADDE